MYAKRNSITIGLLLLILVSAGFFWYKSESNKLVSLKSKNRELSKSLDGSLEVAETLSSTQEQLQLLSQRWNDAPKVILSVDEPSFSLYYLNWLIENYRLKVLSLMQRDHLRAVVPIYL